MSARAGIGVFVVLVACALAVLAPVLAPHDPVRSSVFFLQGPSSAHLFGTDELGRDILSRVIYGTRTSLAIGVGAALLAVIIGAPIGLAAGYLGGRLDIVVVQLIDLFIALPGLVLALIITVMVGPSLQNLVLVLGFVMWPVVARLVRGQALAVREHAYIEAAVAAGGSSLWIIRRHVWPNIFRIVAAQFAITVSFAIITSASLSFLGLGIPPPVPDSGQHGALRLRCAGDQSGAEPGAGGGDRHAGAGLLPDGKLRPMTRAGEPILRVTDLGVSFTAQGRAIQALKGVSFDLYRGETLAIVGESGSGKSTTGLAIMGLIDRARGTSISGTVPSRAQGRHARQHPRTRRSRAAKSARQRRRDDLPGADVVAEPRLYGRRPGHRSAAPAPGARCARRKVRGVRPARRARHRRSGGMPRALPAPAFGRHAPARHDRDRALRRPADPDRRRADHGARRHHPGADPRAAAAHAAAQTAWRSSSSRTISA